MNKKRITFDLIFSNHKNWKCDNKCVADSSDKHSDKFGTFNLE